MEMNRREFLKYMSILALSSLIPINLKSEEPERQIEEPKKQILEYILKSGNEKTGLTLEITNSNPIVMKSELRYNGVANIHEKYKSEINPLTLSTISYSQEKNNEYFGKTEKNSRRAEFFPEELEIRRTDNRRVYTFQADDENLIRDRNNNPVILDPMSLYYFLMQKNPEEIKGKRILCSGGKAPWTYEFEVKKVKGIYRLKATTEKQNAGFECLIKNSKIIKIKNKIAGIFDLEMVLQQ